MIKDQPSKKMLENMFLEAFADGSIILDNKYKDAETLYQEHQQRLRSSNSTGNPIKLQLQKCLENDNQIIESSKKSKNVIEPILKKSKNKKIINTDHFISDIKTTTTTTGGGVDITSGTATTTVAAAVAAATTVVTAAAAPTVITAAAAAAAPFVYSPAPNITVEAVIDHESVFKNDVNITGTTGTVTIHKKSKRSKKDKLRENVNGKKSITEINNDNNNNNNNDNDDQNTNVKRKKDKKKNKTKVSPIHEEEEEEVEVEVEVEAEAEEQQHNDVKVGNNNKKQKNKNMLDVNNHPIGSSINKNECPFIKSGLMNNMVDGGDGGGSICFISGKRSINSTPIILKLDSDVSTTTTTTNETNNVATPATAAAAAPAKVRKQRLRDKKKELINAQQTQQQQQAIIEKFLIDESDELKKIDSVAKVGIVAETTISISTDTAGVGADASDGVEVVKNSTNKFIKNKKNLETLQSTKNNNDNDNDNDKFNSSEMNATASSNNEKLTDLETTVESLAKQLENAMNRLSDLEKRMVDSIDRMGKMNVN